jgi:integrase
MRIGETADLAADCLRHLGKDQWALHIPVGKLHNERWTPVHGEVLCLIARLQFLRTLPPAALPEFLLPRPSGRNMLCAHLRAALAGAAIQAGITAHIVPHQMRHYAASRTMPRGSERRGSRPLRMRGCLHSSRSTCGIVRRRGIRVV